MKNCPLGCGNRIKDFFLHFYKCNNKVIDISVNFSKELIQYNLYIVNTILHMLYIRTSTNFTLKDVLISMQRVMKEKLHTTGQKMEIKMIIWL